MRSCFVPWCDTICKKNQKRMMFLPPKNKEIFEMWRKVLPKKKELKVNDKICERHFRKEDIITTFDHIINGQLFQMERGRPKLKPDAVPCHNLPSEDEEQLYFRVRRGRMTKILKLEVQQLEDKNNLEDEQEEEAEQQEELKDEEKEPENETEMTFIEEKESDKKENQSIKSDDKQVEEIESSVQVDIQALFDFLYDDIFEVILPGTLWGVHRDPERGFIAFSFFDSDSLKTTKLVVLDCKGVLKIFIFNKLVNEHSLTIEVTHEILSNIIAQVDEAKICKKAGENSLCEVKAVENSDFCCNCSI